MPNNDHFFQAIGMMALIAAAVVALIFIAIFFQTAWQQISAALKAIPGIQAELSEYNHLERQWQAADERDRSAFLEAQAAKSQPDPPPAHNSPHETR
jgi:predicted PurR-regulated permease PerM